MAKGSSSSQASTLGPAGRSGGASGPAGPRQSAPSASGVRRRQVANGTGATASPRSAPTRDTNMFRFYSDDAPGLKITPV